MELIPGLEIDEIRISLKQGKVWIVPSVTNVMIDGVVLTADDLYNKQLIDDQAVFSADSNAAIKLLTANAIYHAQKRNKEKIKGIPMTDLEKADLWDECDALVKDKMKTAFDAAQPAEKTVPEEPAAEEK